MPGCCRVLCIDRQRGLGLVGASPGPAPCTEAIGHTETSEGEEEMRGDSARRACRNPLPLHPSRPGLLLLRPRSRLSPSLLPPHHHHHQPCARKANCSPRYASSCLRKRHWTKLPRDGDSEINAKKCGVRASRKVPGLLGHIGFKYRSLDPTPMLSPAT